MEEQRKGNAWALLPLLLFIALFLGVGTITGDFTNMPLNVAITITVIVALIMNRKETFANKVEVFTKEQSFQYHFNGIYIYIGWCFLNYH